MEYAKRAAPYNNWLDGAREDLVDMFIVHSVDEIQGLINAHEQFKATLPEADKEFSAIQAIAQEALHLCQQHGLQLSDNPYTSIQPSELANKWHEVQHLVPLRDQTLHQESNKQKSNDQLRMLFAQKANVVGPWTERQYDQIYNITMNMQDHEVTIAKATSHGAIAGPIQAQHRRIREHQQGNTRGHDLRKSSHRIHNGDHSRRMGAIGRKHSSQYQRSRKPSKNANRNKDRP